MVRVLRETRSLVSFLCFNRHFKVFKFTSSFLVFICRNFKIYYFICLKQFKPVFRIRIRKIFASWIQFRKSMRICGAKYQPKTANKTVLLSKPKSKLLKKKFKNFMISEWFIKLKYKNKRKIRQKIWKFYFVKKFSNSYRNDLDPDPFFSSADLYWFPLLHNLP